MLNRKASLPASSSLQMKLTELDASLGVPRFSPICTFCRHRLGFRRCDAFTQEIPLPIWIGEHTHEQPYPDDHGIQFEPVPEAKVTRPPVPVRSA